MAGRSAVRMAKSFAPGSAPGPGRKALRHSGEGRRKPPAGANTGPIGRRGRGRRGGTRGLRAPLTLLKTPPCSKHFMHRYGESNKMCKTGTDLLDRDRGTRSTSFPASSAIAPGSPGSGSYARAQSRKPLKVAARSLRCSMQHRRSGIGCLHIGCDATALYPGPTCRFRGRTGGTDGGKESDGPTAT